MKEQNNSFNQKLVVGYLSFFYSGFFPKAPGTVGSLATLPLIYLLAIRPLPITTFITLLLLVTIFTCWITDKTQKVMQVHDPQWIVIDEVLGMLTGWLFFYPHTDWKEILVLFILFRFFDIIKIWPASYFDRLTHGSGTILDDIISGIYAGLTILLGKYFLY